MKYSETRKFNLLITVAVSSNLENGEFQERGLYNTSQSRQRNFLIPAIPQTSKVKNVVVPIPRCSIQDNQNRVSEN